MAEKADVKEQAMVDMSSQLSDELLKTMTAEELVKRVEANANLNDAAASAGLKPDQVAARLARDGPNCMSESPPVPLWLRFTKHLLDPMLILLMIAGQHLVVGRKIKRPTFVQGF
jgi:hypothetical protein